MNSNCRGFIALELVASTLIAVIGFLSIASCYRVCVKFMLWHNYKQEAFVLAEENMVGLKNNIKLEHLDEEHDNFRIIGSKLPVGKNSTDKMLFVEVYWGKEAIPLVSLVGYE